MLTTSKQILFKVLTKKLTFGYFFALQVYSMRTRYLANYGEEKLWEKDTVHDMSDEEDGDDGENDK